MDLKGLRTILTGALMVVLPPLLDYFAKVDWNTLLGPKSAIMVSGALMILMRVITTGPAKLPGIKGPPASAIVLGVLLLPLLLGGCAQVTKATTGVNIDAQVVTKEEVDAACSAATVAYLLWEAADAPLPKTVDRASTLKKIRAGAAALQSACAISPTTPREALSAARAGAIQFRQTLDALKAG